MASSVFTVGRQALAASQKWREKQKTKQNRAVVDPEGHCHSETEPGSSRGLRSRLPTQATQAKGREAAGPGERRNLRFGGLCWLPELASCVLTFSDSAGKFKTQKYIWYLLRFFLFFSLSPEMTDLSLIKQ